MVDIFNPTGLTGTEDDVMNQALAARKMPVFPIAALQQPNADAKSGMLPMPPAAPPPGMRLPPPMQITPPAMRQPMPQPQEMPDAMPPSLPDLAAGGDDPELGERTMLKKIGMALVAKGTAAQRVQGLQMISKANQPTEMQLAAQERARLAKVIDAAPAPEEAKRRALIAVHLGVKNEDVLKTLGMDQPSFLGDAAATGPDALAQMPAAMANQVKALAEGRMSFPSAAALRSPYWQTMLQAVGQYDPTFDAVNYQSRAKTRNAFTSGKEGRDLNALNTAMGHLGTLSDIAEELDNFSSVGPGGILTSTANKARNAAKELRQDPSIVKFNTARDKVAEEFTRLYRGAGGSESDIKREIENLNAANSPPQLRQAIKVMADLARSKAVSLGDQYNLGMGTTKDPLELVKPHARDVFERVEQRATAATPSAAKAKAPPAVGTVVKGHKFLGGDPADEMNWERAR